MKTIMVVMALFLFALVVPAYSQSDKDEEACCDRSDWPKEACLDGTLDPSQVGKNFRASLEKKNTHLSDIHSGGDVRPMLRRALELHQSGYFENFKKTHPANFKKDVDVCHMNYVATLKTHWFILELLDCTFYNGKPIVVVVTEGYRPKTDENERGKANPDCSPHVLGFGIDIRPASTDGKETDWRFKNYDRELTELFVYVIHWIDPCAKILFNDPQLKGVKPCVKHDHHLHITWSTDIDTMYLRSFAELLEKYGY